MVAWPGIYFEMFLMENMTAIAFGMLGAFYMFGGYAVLRAIAIDELIDTVIERVNYPEETSEPVITGRFKKRFLGVMALVSFAGGAFLFFQSALATALFCICLAMQLLHVLVLGPRYFDRDEDIDFNESGRQATINAMLIYAVVTVCLLYAQHLGALPSFPHSWSLRESAGLAVTVAFAIYAYRMTRIPPPNTDILQSLPPNDQPLQAEFSNSEQPGNVISIAELRVQATAHEEGLWARSKANDFWETVDPDLLGISIALESRISKWEDRYDQFCDTDEMDALNDEPNWSDPEKQAHFHEAHSIAQRLKKEVTSLHPHKVKVTWVNQDGEILDIPA